MKCLASTQGPKIRVNAVLPGLLLTEWVCSCTSQDILKDQSHAVKGAQFSPERVKMMQDRAVLKQEVRRLLAEL